MKEEAQEALLPEDFEPPEGCCVIATFAEASAAHQTGLAVLAMGEAYWLFPVGEQFVLCVADSKAKAIRKELDEVARLGAKRILFGRSIHAFAISYTSFFVYALLLVGFYVWQYFEPIQLAGQVDANAILLEAQWWRVLTGLTLHGGIVHLVSNIVCGIGFALLVSRFFGAPTGWLLILLSGILGNALNVCIQYPDAHISLGASTSVFGAIGIITGAGACIAMLQPKERWTLPRWMMPVLSGLAFLGILGMGEGPIDIGGHISGFACGLAIGFGGAVRQSEFVRLAQFGPRIYLLTVSLIGLSWLFALNV